jgi:hypothetical protein
MGKTSKKSIGEFMELSKKVHGDEYDYSLVNYQGTKIKIKIICKKHGIFETTPYSHYGLKSKCPKCQIDKRILDTNKFIEKCKKVHGDEYDYSLSNYKCWTEKTKIICKEHGIFEQSPNSHISNKQGCPKCRLIKLKNRLSDLKLSQDEFIEKCKLIHGDKYDYSLVDYKLAINKVKIICPKHGIFEQVAGCHYIQKQGCPKCKSSKGETKIEQFLIKNFIRYERQKTFKDCKNKRYLPFDFYLSELNTCIEYNGKQHYIETEYWNHNKLEQTMKHDSIKKEYCDKNNIELLIIKYIDYKNIFKILSTFV